MIKDVTLLLDAIHLPLCRPEYQPTTGPEGHITHCNSYVNEVCAIYGFRGLEGLLANQIIDLVSKHEQWSTCPFEKAQDLANHGTLIIAGAKAEPHGHVAIVCPGREKVSGRWGQVPSLANVGSTVWIGNGLNWAFSVYPGLWAWRASL